MNTFQKLRYYLLLIPIFFISCSPTAYKILECIYDYGGSMNSITVTPVTNPYTVEGINITFKDSGPPEEIVKTRFLFKAVYILPPADDAAINIYVYYLSDDGPVPVHQVKYLPPFPVRPARDDKQPFGFTGLQNVYDPALGRVFQYYCR